MDRHPALLVTAILAVVLTTGCDTRSGPEFEPAAADPVSTDTPRTTSGPALWPFSDLAEARRWQAQGEGHSPWHVDAEATALFFTTGYLGFTHVDKIIDSEIGATEAKVTVGYQAELAKPAPAAVLRLVRYGDGPTAPWEVVGTIDDTLTITSPAPGTEVGSPVEVSGRVTGVDESIHVQVRDPDQPAPVGDSCCLPAGGENMPWSTTVSIRGAADTTLTIVAATGGHVTNVERFAVTGVRPAV